MDELQPIPLWKRQGKNPLVVTLRPLSLQTILVQPLGYKVIGTVRRGMNMGLLAIGPDGRFVRVNGWYVEHLFQRAVCAAICQCTDSHPIKKQLINGLRKNTQPKSTPQVTIRKRRTVEIPISAATEDSNDIHLPVLSAYFK